MTTIHSDSNMPLAAELAMYAQRKQEWLDKHENEFVVIAGEAVAGFFLDYASAWSAGVKRFGTGSPFLIKQVCSSEPVFYVY
jgi:hypothetical protein